MFCDICKNAAQKKGHADVLAETCVTIVYERIGLNVLCRDFIYTAAIQV